MARRLLAAFLSALVAVPLVVRPAVAQPAVAQPAVAQPAGEDAAPAAASAEAVDETPLDAYRRSAMEVRSSLWHGLRIHQGDRLLDLGFLGANHESVFAGYPEALDAAGTYRTLKVTGFSLWVVGLATLLTTLVLLVADDDLLIETKRTGIVEEQNPTPLFWGLLGGGVVVGVTGGLLMQGADGYLTDAVGHHNRALHRFLKEMSVGDAGAPRAFQVKLGGRF